MAGFSYNPNMTLSGGGNQVPIQNQNLSMQSIMQRGQGTPDFSGGATGLFGQAMSQPRAGGFGVDASGLPATSPMSSQYDIGSRITGEQPIGGQTGGVTAGSVMPAAQAGMQVAQDMGEGLGNIVSSDISAFQGQLGKRQQMIKREREGLQGPTAGPYGDLISEELLIRPDKSIFLDDIPQIDRRTKVTNFLVKYNERTMQGASAGSAGGPWGTLIGGVIGSVIGGIEGIAGNRRIDEMNRQAKEDLLRQYEAVMTKWNKRRASTRDQIAQRRGKLDRTQKFKIGKTQTQAKALGGQKKRDVLLRGMGQNLATTRARDEAYLAQPYSRMMAAGRVGSSRGGMSPQRRNYSLYNEGARAV